MWIFWKIYTWFILLQWNRHLEYCREVYKDDNELSPAALTTVVSKLPWTIVNRLPMSMYSYHSVATSSATILDVEIWLKNCLAVVKRYNNLSKEELEQNRPADTYIDPIIYDRVLLTEVMSQGLDKYMMVGNNQVNALYLYQILEVVKELAYELSLIEDTLDRKYFIRKSTGLMDDLYEVIITLLAIGTLNEK